MRRKEREITDEREIEAIIAGCDCCRVGFNDGGSVYIVPLDFGYVKSGEKYTLYFHSAKAGRKYELLKEAPKVAFEMDRKHELILNDLACKCTAHYQSVMGSGTARIVEDGAEKRAGLALLMKHSTGKGKWEFSQAEVDRVCVFKISVEEISAKASR